MQVLHVLRLGLRVDKALGHLSLGPVGHAAVGIQVEVGPRLLQLLVDGLDGLAALAALVDDLSKLLFHSVSPFKFYGLLSRFFHSYKLLTHHVFACGWGGED